MGHGELRAGHDHGHHHGRRQDLRGRAGAAPAVPGTAAAPSSLRYDVSGARPADLARLQRCLMAHFSGQVIGVSLKDVASQG
jgi:hypothetical protein